ncbi:hypothetical protein N7E81_02160 [Reichenbachiella carrageenanivorans]|uniref:DUF5017 domain-containing protein n=1 Tax=Reichenbachiella carrageenanivorans TaxID=2979869 RepID=A0ABY6D2D5_9BACT|nr:hypothetical protein [Reichenbachiella carrageenanivorans]UXX79909.1 hypothetical protein N7E81_02160 [Reichenbachiella carrageenanivorans]
MKLKNIVYGIIAASSFIWACTDEFTNPELKDTDLTIYRVGEGGNIRGEAWSGYGVLVGDTLQMDLQVSPAEGTAVKWQLENGEVLNETLSYEFVATEEGEQRTYFIATRGDVADTIIFNFRGELEGYSSKVNTWQTVELPNGKQTGTFTYEFDMVPMKDGIDAVTGITTLTADTTYADLSVIIRFDRTGVIDAYDNGGYSAENVMNYASGNEYHVRLEVDAAQMTFDAFVSGTDGVEVQIADAYIFRNKVTNLTSMALVAGDYLLDDPGTHRVYNIEMETHTQNQKPTFAAVEDQRVKEGETVTVAIEANDPLEGVMTMEAQNLPRFATFAETGNGKGILTFSPYADCDGCDLGDYAIEIVATNSLESSTQTINVEVVDPFAITDIPVDPADVDVFFGAYANDPAKPFVWLAAPELLVGGGVNYADANDIYDMAAVMPFKLPNIPDGEEFATAELQANLNNVVTWAIQDYDLYALPYRSSSLVLGTDYYQGVYGGDPNATALQQKWAENTTPIGAITTSSAANTALVDYLNQQVANGAKGGDYVFLRVNVNVADATTYGRIDIDSSESGKGAVLAVSFKSK